MDIKYAGESAISKIISLIKGTYVKKTDIVDNCESSDTDKPLSANQGRELKSQINIANNRLSGLSNEAGSVKTYIDESVSKIDLSGYAKDDDLIAEKIEVNEDTYGNGNTAYSLEDVIRDVDGRMRSIENAEIPTKTSDLTNDSGFITEVPSEVYIGDGSMPEDAVLQLVVEDDDTIADAYRGKSAYEYAKDGGYVGTEQDYANDMNPDNIAGVAKAGLSQIEAPIIVSSVDEMTDTSKHYVLGGNIYYNKTIVTEGETVLVPNFTNLIKFDENGNPTNVVLNKRYSASAGATADYLSAQDGSFAITDVFTEGWVVGSNTVYINRKPNGQQTKVCEMNSNISVMGSVATINTSHWLSGENGEYKVATDSTVIGASCVGVKISVHMETSTITADSLKGLIVTLNEPITYTEQKTEGETVSEWYDTGTSYAPTFKTDLVGVLGENNVIYLSDSLPSGTYTLKYPDNDYATVGTITK